MITLRRSHERGHAHHGWLDTYHSFSFSSYYDPAHMGFSSLRVINDDRVAPAAGFPTHGHRDMEIITYVLEGSLEHKDSMGNGDAQGCASVVGGTMPGATSAIYPGDVQRMSAGTGITHSEYNPSRSEPLHLLQIWIVPDQVNIVPGYEQIHFTTEQKRNRLQLIASPDGRNGALTIHQNAFVYATVLEPGHSVTHALSPQRCAYVHVARGEVTLNGYKLHAGDGARIVDEPMLELLMDSTAAAVGTLTNSPCMDAQMSPEDRPNASSVPDTRPSKDSEGFRNPPALELPCSAEVLIFDLVNEAA